LALILIPVLKKFILWNILWNLNKYIYIFFRRRSQKISYQKQKKYILSYDIFIGDLKLVLILTHVLKKIYSRNILQNLLKLIYLFQILITFYF